MSISRIQSKESDSGFPLIKQYASQIHNLCQNDNINNCRQLEKVIYCMITQPEDIHIKNHCNEEK